MRNLRNHDDYKVWSRKPVMKCFHLYLVIVIAGIASSILFPSCVGHYDPTRDSNKITWKTDLIDPRAEAIVKHMATIIAHRKLMRGK
jgi:hypothetical protein